MSEPTVEYYEVVRLGKDEIKHYTCSICEKEKKMFVFEESEVRIIKHIQKNHPEKHLVVETTKKTTKLVSHSPKEDPQEGTPAKKFKLRQSIIIIFYCAIIKRLNHQLTVIFISGAIIIQYLNLNSKFL